MYRWIEDYLLNKPKNNDTLLRRRLGVPRVSSTAFYRISETHFLIVGGRSLTPLGVPDLGNNEIVGFPPCIDER